MELCAEHFENEDFENEDFEKPSPRRATDG